MRIATYLVISFVTLASTANAQRLVVFGDSISVGAGASSQTRTYVDRISHRIGSEWRTLNYSRSGASVVGAMGYVFPASVAGAIALTPEAVFIALGTNDYAVGVPVETFSDAYRLMLQQFVNFPTIQQIFCLTPIYRSDDGSPNFAGAVLDDYRNAIATECAAAGGVVFDGKEAMPNSDAFLAALAHPNDRGHRTLARWLTKRLRPYLP